MSETDSTPTVEELISRAANGDESAVELLSLNEDALEDQTTDDVDGDDQDGDPDGPFCTACDHALKFSSTFAYHGPGYDYRIEQFFCQNCSGQGGAAIVTKQGWPDEDSTANLTEKLERERSPYRCPQTPFHAAVYIDGRFPDGVYRFDRITPFSVELTTDLKTDDDVDITTWKQVWGDWDNAQVGLIDGKLRFVDRMNARSADAITG